MYDVAGPRSRTATKVNLATCRATCNARVPHRLSRQLQQSCLFSGCDSGSTRAYVRRLTGKTITEEPRLALPRVVQHVLPMRCLASSVGFAMPAPSRKMRRNTRPDAHRMLMFQEHIHGTQSFLLSADTRRRQQQLVQPKNSRSCKGRAYDRREL